MIKSDIRGRREKKERDWVGGASDSSVFLGQPYPDQWELLDQGLSIKGA